MAKIPDCIPRLEKLGISDQDAYALRRIAMTLHRWHERECGTEHGAIERDEKTRKVHWYSAMTGKRAYRVPDRETPALARLEAIMANYPGLLYYVQGDPRGAPIYVMRETDIPQPRGRAELESYYSRGVAVYK